MAHTIRWSGKVWFTDRFKGWLDGIPESQGRTLVLQVVRIGLAQLKRDKVSGPGAFFYLPLTISGPDASGQVVVCYCVNPYNNVNQGDVSIYFRGEWDTDKNPLPHLLRSACDVSSKLGSGGGHFFGCQ